MRIVSGAQEPLRHETIVLVLDGRARAGTLELAAGDAAIVPAGTAFAVEPNGHTLLVGR